MGVKINYQIVTGPDHAYTKVKSIITPEYIQKFKVTADINYDDVARKVTAKGPGFTLVLSLLQDHCDLDLDLSFLLRPLKKKILEIIGVQIKKNL